MTASQSNTTYVPKRRRGRLSDSVYLSLLLPSSHSGCQSVQRSRYSSSICLTWRCRDTNESYLLTLYELLWRNPLLISYLKQRGSLRMRVLFPPPSGLVPSIQFSSTCPLFPPPRKQEVFRSTKLKSRLVLGSQQNVLLCT